MFVNNFFRLDQPLLLDPISIMWLGKEFLQQVEKLIWSIFSL